MVDYFEVAKYPLLDLKNFLIGFVMSSLFFLIVPLFFVYGYMVETIRETINQSNNLPHWFNLKNWKTFLKHGFFVFIIISAYLLPALLMSITSTAFVNVGSVEMFQSERPWEDGTFSQGGGIQTVGLSLLFFGSVLFFVAMFLLPMAIILYSASEDIKMAFNIEEIFLRIKRTIIPYIKAYAVSIFVFFLAFLLLLIPGVGFLMGGILFYPLLFSARLFAEVFREYEYY